MLDRKINQLRAAGYLVEVKDAPSGATTFDKMILVYLPREKPFLYQVHFWNTESSKVVSSFG